VERNTSFRIVRLLPNIFVLGNAGTTLKAKLFYHPVHLFREIFLAPSFMTALMSGIVETLTSSHLALYSIPSFLPTISLTPLLLSHFISFLPLTESHLSKLNYSTFALESLDLLLSFVHVRRRLAMPMLILMMIRLLFSHL